MKFLLFRAVLVLAMVCIALARELPFAANDRQACVGENQRCFNQHSTEECCGDFVCECYDYEYVDCDGTGTDLFCH